MYLMTYIVNGLFSCHLSAGSDTSDFETMLKGLRILIVLLLLRILFSEVVFSAKKVNIIKTNLCTFFELFAVFFKEK